MPRFVVLALPIVVSLGTGACGGSELEPVLVPGTERIEPGGNAPWFTISSHERYMAFMEVDSSDWGAEATEYHLVTMDLATSEKTHHHLRDVPPRVLGTGLRPWQFVSNGFAVPGWQDDTLLVHIRGNRPITHWLAFVPGEAAARVVPAPLHPSCSDCPPPEQWLDLAKSRDLQMDPDEWPLHVPYRNGRFSDSVYRAPIGSAQRGAVIERVRPDGTTEVLVERERALKELQIGSIRVSPDEQYLAYVLISQLKSPVPLPTLRDELFVRNLSTGEERRTPGTYRVLGNLIWSADSRRLYYAAVDGSVADGRRDGVYCVDLSEDE